MLLLSAAAAVAAAEEIIHFLRSRKASRLQEQEKVALLERVFATVRPLDASSIEVELRCAFTQHRPTLQRILNAAACKLTQKQQYLRQQNPSTSSKTRGYSSRSRRNAKTNDAAAAEHR